MGDGGEVPRRRRVLQDMGAVVCLCPNAGGAMFWLDSEPSGPDAAVVELLLPDAGGLQVVEYLSRAPWLCASVVCAPQQHDSLVEHCFARGVAELLIGETNEPALRGAVGAAVVRTSGWRGRLEPRPTPFASPDDDEARLQRVMHCYGLNAREQKVALKLMRGRSDKEIAYELRAPLTTIKRTQRSLRRKTLSVSRAGVVAQLLRPRAPMDRKIASPDRKNT